MPIFRGNWCVYFPKTRRFWYLDTKNNKILIKTVSLTLISATYFYYYLTLSGLTLWNTSRGLGGGQICPPFDYGYRRMFSLFSFSQGSFLGCKGSESKSTAIYFKKYSPESFWKNCHFLQNLKKMKNSLFGNQTFCQKKCRQN